jgi:hypothetical protein
VNAPERHLDWTDANQRLLVAEFARLKHRLTGEDAALAGADAEVNAARAQLLRPGAIDVVAAAFSLSAFERDLVLLAAGIEMDHQIARLCGEATGQPQRPWATFGLALAALPDAHWSALAPNWPLRRWHLLEVEEGQALSNARLSLDERVLHFLAGIDLIDARVAVLLRAIEAPPPMAPTHLEQARAIADALDLCLASGLAATRPCLIHLHGDDACAREDMAASVASRLGWRLFALDPQALPAAPSEISLLAALCEREAVLGGLAFYSECVDEPPSPALLRFVDVMSAPLFVGAARLLAWRGQPQVCAVARAPTDERRGLWREALGGAVTGNEAEFDAAFSHFRCDARRIARIGAGLRARQFVAGDLWRACRESAPPRLAELAQRIDTQAEWDDLVLPDVQKRLLAQIVVHTRRRFEVHGAWGFAAKGGRGLGVTVLFAGESGTGKTLAAEVLARTLQIDLFRIDLSAVISKYIGETEKNLKRVFDAAEDSGAMLLFDEADALFGKRSDVKDSHDRYANIEVSYLLQRMETYSGLAVLTTNHRAALDAAFLRRLRFIVQFPYPEAAEREAIWQRVFPAATPIHDLAYSKLARLQVAGGHIHNIALGAAFHAAEEGAPVGMTHVLRAAHADAAKRERPISDAETRGWV